MRVKFDETLPNGLYGVSAGRRHEIPRVGMGPGQRLSGPAEEHYTYLVVEGDGGRQGTGQPRVSPRMQ